MHPNIKYCMNNKAHVIILSIQLLYLFPNQEWGGTTVDVPQPAPAVNVFQIKR